MYFVYTFFKLSVFNKKRKASSTSCYLEETWVNKNNSKNGIAE